MRAMRTPHRTSVYSTPPPHSWQVVTLSHSLLVHLGTIPMVSPMLLHILINQIRLQAWVHACGVVCVEAGGG